MAVDQSDVVDFIGIDPDTGAVRLGITDHLGWADDEREHARRLDDKLGTYLHFIRSGQLERTYPHVQGRRVGIDLYLRFVPSRRALRFLDRAQDRVEAAGYDFSYSVLAEEDEE
jgi:hypothetical protein